MVFKFLYIEKKTYAQNEEVIMEESTSETTPFMNKEDVINYILKLKKYVKQSHIDNQNHLDVSLVDASERDDFYKNIAILRKAIDEKILSKKEYEDLLGL